MLLLVETPSSWATCCLSCGVSYLETLVRWEVFSGWLAYTTRESITWTFPSSDAIKSVVSAPKQARVGDVVLSGSPSPTVWEPLQRFEILRHAILFVHHVSDGIPAQCEPQFRFIHSLTTGSAGQGGSIATRAPRGNHSKCLSTHSLPYHWKNVVETASISSTWWIYRQPFGRYYC